MNRKISLMALFVFGLALVMISCVLTPTPAPPKPDLVILPAPDNTQYCNEKKPGILTVSVKNQNANTTANSSNMKVTFYLPNNQSQDFPAIVPILNTTDPIANDFAMPADCFIPDCHFTITVDDGNAVDESDEGNNSVDGKCNGFR